MSSCYENSKAPSNVNKSADSNIYFVNAISRRFGVSTSERLRYLLIAFFRNNSRRFGVSISNCSYWYNWCFCNFAAFRDIYLSLVQVSKSIKHKSFRQRIPKSDTSIYLFISLVLIAWFSIYYRFSTQNSIACRFQPVSRPKIRCFPGQNPDFYPITAIFDLKLYSFGIWMVWGFQKCKTCPNSTQFFRLDLGPL